MIPRKKKICKECNKEAFIWSKGRCKECSSKDWGKIRTTKNVERIEADKLRREKDLKFYTLIWSKRIHVCFNCNKGLGPTPNLLYFHHIIRKSSHPEFRYDEENIVLLCGECHNQVETDISKAPKVKQLTIELLKKKYGN